ncbi:diacylglycerol/lipid kinase family protein [Salinarimonas rosea]|uniref:diacylglycerol/lipid kinase family protein n=1 Tax=Salinarimonas rosea TaxID=552063 RepID=UPI0004242A77|nr:diacylglycerol kinase family protein [Salinarimonas rosea]
MPRATLVYNPTAGADPVPAARLAATLVAAGFETRVVSTKEDDVEEALAEPASGAPGDLVVAAGGDGTVARVMRALGPDAPPLAIVPLGTGNNVAHALGLPIGPDALGAALHDARPRAWRTARLVDGDAESAPAESPPVESTLVEGLDLGALAAGLRAAGESGLDGPPKIAHGRAVLARTLATAPPVRIRLALDDGAQETHDVLFLAALVCGRVGPALTLCPRAAGGETLAVVALAPERRDAFRAWLADPEGPAPVAIRHAARLRVWAPEGTPWRADDTFAVRETGTAPMTLAVRTDSVRILVPRSPPENAP